MSLIEQPQAAPAADQQVVAPGLGDQPVIQGGTDAPPQQTDAEARARQLGWVPQEEFRGDPSRWRSAEEYVERGYNEPSIARATIERLQSRIETQEREFGHRLRSIERMSDVALSRQKQQLTASFDQRIREAASVGDMAAFDRLNTEKVQAVREHDLEVADQRWRQPKQQAPQGGGLSSSDQAAVDEWAASNKWVTTNQEMATLADMVSKRLARERPGLTAHQNLAEVTRERDGLLVAQRPSRTAPAPRSHDAERPVSDYRRACAQARAMAMATGRAVRVG